MLGLSVVAATFIAVVVSFFCTEYLVLRFAGRSRPRLDERSRLSKVLLANLISLEILWVGGIAFGLAADGTLRWEIFLACVCIQAIWTLRHLRLFQRDHIRMRDQDRIAG